MSFHRNPKYQIPALIQALKDHGLEHDTPSQLSDAFRTGWMAAQSPSQPLVEVQEPGHWEKLRELGWTLQDCRVCGESAGAMTALVLPLTEERIRELYAEVQKGVAQLEAEDRYTFAGWFPIAVRLVEKEFGIGASSPSGSGEERTAEHGGENV